MYKILKADKDAYITNRVIKGNAQVNANVGGAASLDLFKLYGLTRSGSVDNRELSRLLVHFDLSRLSAAISAGEVNPNDSTFSCTLSLKDVYGGQTTPTNFNVAVVPLSRSFSEGIGRDVVYYSDVGTCNYLSASQDVPWIVSGAAGPGAPTSICDYVTGSSNQYVSSQFFVTGEEDLNVDVTAAIRAILTGTLPDSGFRVSFEDVYENDTSSYFVKRFGSRTAFNQNKRPSLIVKCNTAILDDSLDLTIDSSNSVYLTNVNRGQLTDIVSGSTTLTGSSCVIFRLKTEISGGWYTIDTLGDHVSTGIYSSSFTLNRNNTINTKLQESGSIDFSYSWLSLDESITYASSQSTLDRLTARPPSAKMSYRANQRPYVSFPNLPSKIRSDELVRIRVKFFDPHNPTVKMVKLPTEQKSLTFKTFYQIRDLNTNTILIPYVESGATRLSTDIDGCWFDLDAADLVPERSYVIDLLVIDGINKLRYDPASPPFTVTDIQ